MALSGLPHAPWSIALHCTIGVNEATRDLLRTMDVFFIVTCAGAGMRAVARYRVYRSCDVWVMEYFSCVNMRLWATPQGTASGCVLTQVPNCG
jgi:hypothetical protein